MTVIIHPEAIHNLLRTQSGPLGQWLEKKGKDVTHSALTNAGGGGPGPRIITGDLLRHTTWRGVQYQPTGDLMAVIGSGPVMNPDHRQQDYPWRQETGDVTPSGVYYRYPFLEPALRWEFNQPGGAGS